MMLLASRCRQHRVSAFHYAQRYHSTNPASLMQAAEWVLDEKSPKNKVKISFHAQNLWQSNTLPLCHTTEWSSAPPDFPARPETPRLYYPKEMPSEKEFPIPIAILHALAHIELGAIDNYWDTVARFEPTPSKDMYTLPREFYDDFSNVACDEARHFNMVNDRLESLGSFYGALPAHRALLEHANNTRNSLAARLAVVPLVQEARGLDAGPRLVHKLKSIGDHESAAIVAQIVEEERGHVSLGIKWFKYLCNQVDLEPIPYFHSLVRQFFPEGLPGPFNMEARLAAHMEETWYIPLELKKKKKKDEKSTEKLIQFNNSNKILLLAGSVWPERTSSAAGVRTCDMIDMLIEENWNIICISPSRMNSHTEKLIKNGIKCYQIDPNTNEFKNKIEKYQINIALFDRYIAEEMYGWHVYQHTPNAIRLLDLQDIHFLRKTREYYIIKKNIHFQTILSKDLNLQPLLSMVLRELASILRSNATIYVSEFEKDLLVDTFGISKDQLLPFPYIVPTDTFEKSLATFNERQHIAVVGSFKHAPNLDGYQWLKRELWPKIKKNLDPDIELHIYGSYASSKDLKLLDAPHENFRVLGFCNDVHETMSKYRLTLAPLRFGAGIKGKIIDSWMTGTPVVSTSIGTEGMYYEKNKWGGEVANTPEEFALKVMELYKNPITWNKAVQNGIDICKKYYNRNEQKKKFLQFLSQPAQINWIARILWSNQFRATEFMSKYIQIKNEKTGRE